MIAVEHEDMEELRAWGLGLASIQERCIECSKETRYWHRASNQPVCQSCATELEDSDKRLKPKETK